MVEEQTLRKVLGAVGFFVSRHGGTTYPGVRKLAARARVDKGTVAPALLELQTQGLLTVQVPEGEKAWRLSLTDEGRVRLYGSEVQPGRQAVQTPVHLPRPELQKNGSGSASGRTPPNQTEGQEPSRRSQGSAPAPGLTLETCVVCKGEGTGWDLGPIYDGQQPRTTDDPAPNCVGWIHRGGDCRFAWREMNSQEHRVLLGLESAPEQATV